MSKPIHGGVRRRVAATLSLALPLAGVTGSQGAASAEATAPTFTKNVAPILYKNCVPCHRPRGAASRVPLLAYEAVKLEAKKLREKVRLREMPPWPVDSAHSLPFRNDPRLSQDDIDTLIAWVDAGAPKGADADLPVPPVFAQGWLHPQGRAPDLVLSLPRFNVHAEGTIPYIEKLIPVPFTGDRWIAALQVRAGNPALLHHMGITEVALPEGVTPELLEAIDGVATQIGSLSGRLQVQSPVVADPSMPGNTDMLAVYTPGTTFESYGTDRGKLIRGGANRYINFNIHYTTTGREESDQSELALWFEPRRPTHVLFRVPAAVSSIIANGRELFTDDPGTKAEGTAYALPPIPANAGHYELIGATAYREPITIYQLQPHAHVRASDFTYTVVYPDGRESTILHVPHYSYHFQLAYALATPLTLPAGSKLIVTAHYDNSPTNEKLRHLGTNEAQRKCGPDHVAYFTQQNQSWDEMFTPLVQYAVEPGPGTPLPLVTAVGCLVRGRTGGWGLEHGSAPQASDTQGTSSAELRASAAMPLGSARYQLLGVDGFDPSSHAGSRVVVKGVLIPAGGAARLNVTSLQSTSSTCPP